MTTQEQMFGVLIIVGVIFSILTNVALYYYGEYRTLRKKYESDEDIVRREFLFGKLREIDRRIYDIKDMVNG